MTKCPNCGHEIHEPKHVSLADPLKPKQRTDKAFRILDDGRIRELRLRVARGVIRDVENREPRPGREL